MPLKTSKPKKAAGFVKPGPKKTKKAVPVPEPEEDSDDEDMSDSSEEAVPVPVTKNAKKNVNGNAAADSDDDSEDDDDDSEEEEEEEPVKAKAKKAVNGTKKQKQEVEEEDDDDDDDDEEESEEEEPAPVKVKQAVKAKKAPAMEVEDEEDSDEEEDSEEEDDDEEDDDEEEEEETVVQKKRKATGADKPAKKAKVDAVISLYVANLTTDIEEAKIRKFFKKQGISVSDIRHKAPKTFCYVDLENSDDLEKALALSGQKLKGQELKIEQAKQRGDAKAEKMTPQKDDAPKKRADDNCLLFVKNLPEDVTKEMLAEVFSDAKDVRLPLSAEGNFRGFAFVEFNSEADVDTAMEEKQGTDLEGKSLFLDYTGSKSKGAKKSGSFGGAQQQRKSFGEAGKTKVLFVKNLSFNLTKEGLQEAFEGATTARIATFPDTGKPRGFGFVEFDSPTDATAAFEAMNGTELEGRELKLDYATEQQNSPRPFGGRGGGGRGGRGGFDRGGRGGFRGSRGFGGRGRGGDRGGRGRGGFRGGRGGSTEFKGSRKSFDD